jgi:beta-lactamase regulating signal transducer with metallopeptidase domain
MVHGFTVVLRASCLGGAAVLLVLGLRMLRLVRVAPSWRCWLWLPVAVLFVMPRLPDLGLHRKTEFLPAAIREVVEPIPPRPPEVIVRAEGEATETASGALISVPDRTLSAVEWIAFIWLTGTVGLFILWLGAYVCLWRRVRRGRKPVPDFLHPLLRSCAQEAGLRKTPRVLVTEAMDNPAVAGLFRPVVLVPYRLPAVLDDRELRLVLQHEIWHLKRCDLWYHWFSAFLLAAHWFNPLLWIAVRRFRADRESACDAAVLSANCEDVRSFYGETLIKLQAQLAGTFCLRTLVGILGGADHLRARIVDIASFGRNSRRAGGFAMFAVIAGSAALALFASEPPKTEIRPALLATAGPPEGQTAAETKNAESVKRESLLQQLDVIAGVVEKQIFINSKFIAFDVPKGERNPVDCFFNNPEKKSARKPRQASLSMVGTYTDPQYQVILRALAKPPVNSSGKGDGKENGSAWMSDLTKAMAKCKPVSLLSSPSVTTRSGQRAMIEVVREFIYPTAFDRKESDQPGGNPQIVPSAFSMRPVGHQLEVDPVLGQDGKTIFLSLGVEVNAFLKWQEFKADDGQFIRNPVFGKVSNHTSVMLEDGHTVAFAGQLYLSSFQQKKLQDLVDHPPGDDLCPALIFVTAKMIDPSGATTPEQERRNRGIILPSLDLENVTVPDAVSQICELSRKHDLRGQGMNVVVRHPATDSPRISLHLRDAKMSNVLWQLAKAAGLELSVEGNTVVFVPAGLGGKLSQVNIIRAAGTFLEGDHIEMVEVLGSAPNLEIGDRVVVKGKCTLASRNTATLSLYTTQIATNESEWNDPTQDVVVKKGENDFELSCTIHKKGYLHLTLYDRETRKPFGSVYFGTALQMAEWEAYKRKSKTRPTKP